jgi:hypothetical protein
MAAAKFCCDCTHWEKVTPQLAGDNFGVCHSTTVAMKVAINGKTHLNEDGILWTAQYFGCICWQQNDGSLLSTDDVVKKIIK